MAQVTVRTTLGAAVLPRYTSLDSYKAGSTNLNGCADDFTGEQATMKKTAASIGIGLLLSAGVMFAQTTSTNTAPVPPPQSTVPVVGNIITYALSYISTNGALVGGYGWQSDGGSKGKGAKKVNVKDNAGPTTGLNVDLFEFPMGTKFKADIGLQTTTLFGVNSNVQLLGPSQSIKWNAAGIKTANGMPSLFSTMEVGVTEGYPVDMAINNRFYASKLGLSFFFACNIPF